MSNTNAIEAVDLYAYWRGTLAGKRLPMVEDEPQPGFYRRKDRGRYVPVAIWLDTDGLHMLENGQPVGDNRQLEVWSWCAGKAIEEDTYHAMLAGDVPTDPVYGELDSGADGLLQRATALANLPTRIASEADAMRLADALHMSRAVEKRANDQRKEMEAPHKAVIDEIKALMAEPASIAKSAQDPLKAALLAHIKETGKPVKGQLGKAVSMRIRKIRVVTDHAAALNWFVDHKADAFKALIEKLASGIEYDVPGTEIKTVESVQ